MEITPASGGCGADVRGVDLNALSDDEVEAIADAQAAHGVVFFRDQRLTPDGQLAAAGPDLQQQVAGLRGVHSSRHVFGQQGYYATEGDERYANAEQATQDAVHPMVIRHPRSGKPALYVNPAFTVGIEGWAPAEAGELLATLYDIAKRPEHTCRFQWHVGSVAFWDNRATWHYALNDYPTERRLMHRVTVEGTELAAYSAQ